MHHWLLGLKGGIDAATGKATVNTIAWDDPTAVESAEQAAEEPGQLISVPGAEHFEVLPLLIATDGAIRSINLDGRVS
jgi:hypothetical protein